MSIIFSVVHNPYAEEAQTLWGQTDAYRESSRRLHSYTNEDIEMAKKQAAEAVLMFVDARDAGLQPTSEQAALAAEAHRQAISDWWYECSYEIQVGLADMYLADERFKAYYENIQEGLAQYVHDAIVANAISRI